MRKFTRGILAGLCAVVGFAAVAVAPAVTAPVDVETAYAETTYTTKDVAMMGRVAGWHGNGNFEIRLTLGAADWTEEAQKSYVGSGDLAGALRSLDFFNHIQVGGKTLAEWGCTACYDNIYWLNSSEPDYTLTIPLSMGKDNMTAATAAGVGGGSLLTILEGALIPSNTYLQGDTTATVYRAGCDYVTTATGLAYGIKSVAKTEVESVAYVQGHDGNCGYFGVSLKGDDYACSDGTKEWNRGPYGSSEFTSVRYTEKLLVNGVAGKAGEYGLFNLGSKGQGFYCFAFYSTEAETESVTIPAGTLFPSFAMNTLHTVNGNPVYMYYETQTDVTFYKQADGSFAKPYVNLETSVTAAKVQEGSSETDTFTVLSLSNHDYPTTADNYGGSAMGTKAFLANSNFYEKVLIDGVALGSTNEAYLNIWGNKGAIGFRTSQNLTAKEITVLAGCEIPSYAVLSTGERVQYVTTEDISFVKNANGEWVEKSSYVGGYLEAAKVELDAYKAGLFREVEEAQRAEIIATAKASLNDTLSEEQVQVVVANAKAAIDALKTAAQYADEELAAVKSAAVAELEGYKADGVYFEEQSAERVAAINAGKEAVANAANEAAIAAAVASAKAAVDSVQTKEQVIASAKATLDGYKADKGYFKAEEAAKRDAYVAAAKTEIDGATTQAAVNAAVNAAKAAIDALLTAAEAYVTTDTAMLARTAGWHGNGNFEIRITLGAFDYTGASAQVAYAGGELKTILAKLDFFNKIKLGDKTLADWGCTACYDNIYWVGNGGPQYTLMIPLSMSRESMAEASAAGAGPDYPITILEGALIPSYGYLTKSSDVVYRAGCDYVSANSEKAYGIEATAKVEVEDVKYVQAYNEGTGYFGISFVGDDYLGDGSQLEINQDYYYDGKFTDLILVNGEAGKVGYYGLFNLGEAGKGYYAFQMKVPEEEIVSITIPAGTKFPTRAMTTLFAVNNNPVYIMYEVEETITLYKSENGYVSYNEYCLSKVENYKAGLFREAEEEQRQAIVAQAVADLKTAADMSAMDAIVADALAAIDALKTAGQYADEENAALLEAKNNAIAGLEAYNADEEYFAEQAAERVAIIEAAKTALNDVANESDIAPVIDAAKVAIDELAVKSDIVNAAKETLNGYKADKGYFREEQAAQRDAIVAEALTVIDNATTQEAVSNAVATAKAAIDKLVTAAEYYETTDVAMLGRTAGWHGNGNFEIRITLGAKDWTDEDGQYNYAGELAQLLNKLDFFNKIKLGNKTLAEWGCTACYDNIYWIGSGGPQYTIMLPMAMSRESMAEASAAGIGADYPITILEGALIPGYGYLNKTGNVVYRAGCTYVSATSSKAYGIEATAKTEVEDLKYVQGFDGTCGYLGISLVGDDYLGDGTQLDVNDKYYFDNKFSDLILVNGEPGLVGYYGLFNLGEKGVGYYAFQIFMSEDEIVSITIPAGTRFPTRAMTTLYAVNNNPVYIMYEVAEEITLYKTANGFGTYAGAVVPELEGYKAGLFREAEEAQRLAIIEEAKFAISVAENNAAIDLAVAEAKAAIDALKTAAQYADEELATDKQAAVVTIEGYKADVVYLEEQATLRVEAIDAAKAAVAAATNVEEIEAAVEQAKTAIDALTTKAEIVEAAKAEVEGYKADAEYFDAQAAEKAAVITAAYATIEGATTEAAVNEAVEAAKVAIDEIKTKAEVEEDTLNAQKAEANAKVDALKKAIDFDLYDDEAVATINSLYSTVKAAITNATSEAEINEAVAAFETALAEVPQKGTDDNTSEDVSSDVTTSEEQTSNEEKSEGCFGGINAITFGVIALGLGVMKLFKKKED